MRGAISPTWMLGRAACGLIDPQQQCPSQACTATLVFTLGEK
jgi:hypothetical protein